MSRILCCAATVAALLLGGCGGSSTPNATTTFKHAFVPTVNEFRATSQVIGKAIQSAPSHTDAQLGQAFQSFAHRWQATLSKLNALKVPPRFQVDFNTLASAASRTESDLTGIVSAAETHSKAAATQASASLINDILAAKAASARITGRLGVK
jgi:hypothetical protein